MHKITSLIPIRAKQFPCFIAQMFIRRKVLAKEMLSVSTFHLCYFSCHSYFKYLYCSLHSLVKFCPNHNIKVYIFNDNEQPLSEAQIITIQELIPGTEIISWPKSMGWGAEQIKRIWKAYAKVAEHASDNDMIARIDSDVFFFNDTIFRAVARSDADLIGDGHFVNFCYTQGGCYFFKASAVKKITHMLESETIDKILTEIDTIVEDIAAHHFAKRLNLKIWLTWFMMFPDELTNAGGLNRWARWKFSCLHFVMKNKEAMLKVYETTVLKKHDNADNFKKNLIIK